MSRIMFVGEHTLSSFSTKIFNDCVAEAGILPENHKVTSVVTGVVTGNDMNSLYEGKGKNRKPSPRLVEERHRLKCEIVAYCPNVIVAMGPEALTSLCGLYGISKWRGSVLDNPLGKVIPTINPHSIMYDWASRPVFVIDLKRALKESAFPEYLPPNIFLYTMPTMEAIRNYIADCHEAKLISFDIETESNQITCIGLSYSPKHAMCIPFWFGSSGSLWKEHEEKEIWILLQFLLESQYVKKIAQNGTYDCEFLKRVYGIRVQGFEWDTMLMAHTLYPELPKGLDFLTSIYTDIPYYKDQIKSDKMQEYFEYNAKDAVATHQIYLEQKKELRDAGLEKFYKDHVHALIEPLAGMVERGVRFDVERKEEVKKTLEADVIRLQGELEVAVGHPININSSKQMIEWLYGELKIPAKYKMRKAKGEASITTDAETLEELYGKTKNQAIKIVLEIREKKKLISTYLGIKLDPDKRIRCSYNIAGTETGRLSSSTTASGTGTNLQNIPSGVIKSLFLADKGYTLINADLSQAEARVVAHLARESRLIKVFSDGGDIHRRNASVIYGVSEGDVTPEQRNIAKRVVHASNYGMGARTFAKNVKLTERESDVLLKQYFATYPRIKLWHTETADTLRRTRILRNPFGRRRIFFSRWDDSLIKEGLAFVPQSSVADAVNLAIINIHRKLAGRDDIQLLLQVHDSIVMQARDEKVCEAVELLVKEMSIVIPIGEGFTIPVDVKVGKNWEDMH